MPTFLRPLQAAVLPLLLSACMLGPDYVKPELASDALAQPQLPRAAAADVLAASPPQRWWEALHDAQLTQLVEQTLANSPNLRAAQARVEASRALLRQRRAERLPAVAGSAGYVNAQVPDSLRDGLRGVGQSAAGSALGQQLSALDQSNVELYTAAFDASWELDLYGRRRRAQQQAQAQNEADLAQLADAQVQLAAEVGRAYANYRGSQQRLLIAQDSRDKAARMLELTRQRRAGGAATQIEVERVLAQLRQQEASIPNLQATLQESLDQLALMCGEVPGALDTQLAAVQALPQLPAVVPVDDAAALIRRRPDVRQAERELAASSAQIGQALSAYFPQVSLYGTLGMGASSPSGFGSDALASMVVPMLRWSILDFGKTRAQVAQARAGNQAYLANYEAKLLAALQDANSALARYGAARRTLLVTAEAADAASRSAMLVQQRYQAGASSLIDALDVQRQQLSANDARVQAQIRLLMDYIGLQKSLGLGWQSAQQSAFAK